MRRTYRYDPDLDAMVELTGSNHPDTEPSGLQIIRDIEPYRTVASDVASGGATAVIGSRSRHRNFLRDNGYTEVGNDTSTGGGSSWVQERQARDARVEDIRRAMGDYGSNTGRRE